MSNHDLNSKGPGRQEVLNGQTSNCQPLPSLSVPSLNVQVVRDFEGRSQGPSCSSTTVEEMGQVVFSQFWCWGFQHGLF